MHSCSDLLVASTNFTEENFPDVVKGDEFLNLSFAEVCTLISSDQVSQNDTNSTIGFLTRTSSFIPKHW